MIKKILLPIALLLGLFVGRYEQSAHEKTIEATCRVKIYAEIPNLFSKFVCPKIIQLPIEEIGTGTGVIINEDEESYYLLTAGHVVKLYDYKYIKLDFKNYKDVPCEEIFAKFKFDLKEHVDFAILEIKKKDLNVKLPTIPLSDVINTKKDVVFTTGCARGEESSITKTNITFIKEQKRDVQLFIDFLPAAGRSGSGVFNWDGSRVIGIITRSNGECVPAKKILEILKKELSGVDFSVKNAIMGYHQWTSLFLLQCGVTSKVFSYC